MTTLVVLLTLMSVAEDPTAAIVYVTRGGVTPRQVSGIGTEVAEAFLAAGVQTKPIGAVQGKRGEEMRACFSDTDCLARLAAKVGATHLVLAVVVKSGGNFSAEIVAWTAGLDPHKAQIGASGAAEIGFSVARTAGWALGRFESKQLARARAAESPGPARAEPPETVASTESIDGELPRDRNQQITLGELMSQTPASTADEPPKTWAYREEAPSPDFAIQLLAAGGLWPLKHNRTYLATGDKLVRHGGGFSGGAPGVPSAALGVAMRLPWRALPGLYQTDVVTYGISGTLLLLSFDAGLEKRWPLLNGFLNPLLGGSANVALLGLPVRDGDTEQTATAWGLGATFYGGTAVALHPRLAVHLHAGYRLSLRKASLFGAGNNEYYARDAHGDTWVLDPTGLMARLGLSFEL